MAYTTINKSSEHFNTKLYTGNGSTQSITGVGFQSDWSWFKSRTNAEYHQLIDAVRGNTKIIHSNHSQAETTSSSSLTSFDSDGFTLGNNDGVNNGSETFASWNWKANGAGSSNTDGSITSTVSANTTSGFSIVKYTGTGSNTTVGHGLGVAPSMVITKRLSGADDWVVWHKGLANFATYLFLNSTSGEMGSVAAYQNIAPTATLLYPGSDGRTNGNGQTYISYCFADVQGYSKFSSYTGNGATLGPFVYTGFKPAFVMFKKTSGSADNWQLWDNKRDTYNPVEKALHPDIANTASTDQDIDFLSNGFKIRSSVAHINQSGVKSIYMAFAEAPLVGSNGVTAKAR